MSLVTRPTDIRAAVACYRFLNEGLARELRQRAGLSPTELASELGADVDAATLERWERGESVPVGHRATAYGHALQALANDLDHTGAEPAIG